MTNLFINLFYTENMFYYHVWVRSNRYHGHEPLTYAYSAKLKTGSIVEVELQKELVLGFVSSVTTQPKFKTKPINKIYDLPPLPLSLIKLMQWLQIYYPAPLGILAQQLLPTTIADKQIVKLKAAEAEAIRLDLLPPLTKDQLAANEAMRVRNSYLLHGITGSGKTRLYIELTAQAVMSGQSAIILTPEISLTTQLANNFREVFGDRVIVMHSGQAPNERQQAWLKCLTATQPIIVIGPRSVLFSPVPKLGLIILDEAHEAAYKQEQSPQYQAGRVAAYLAGISRSKLILGSATPSISDYYLAEQKNKPIITLSGLAKKSDHPASDIVIIDRKQHDQFSRSPILSTPLIKAIELAISRNEQSLLYLNRRGTARIVMCENCGWQATCPHCDIPLTYHGDSYTLRCHSCNYHVSSPVNCPDCKHPSVIFKTAGTKAVVDEVQRLFPDAKIARFDTDNLKADRFEENYHEIRDGDSVDILVGTQLLAKGLDLPRLSTLGIVLADTSLYMPDFSAEERTYQLITQVLGRIGRGHVAGKAIIQTYHPEHPILKAAVAANYQKFYKAELASRQQFLFPPFCYLLKISVRRASVKSAEKAAADLKHSIEAGYYKVRIEGPAPCFYERFQNKYQWQLVIKALERSELLRIIESLPANCSYDIDPMDLL